MVVQLSIHTIVGKALALCFQLAQIQCISLVGRGMTKPNGRNVPSTFTHEKDLNSSQRFHLGIFQGLFNEKLPFKLPNSI